MSTLTLREQGDPLPIPIDDYKGRWEPLLDVLQRHRILRVRTTGRFALLFPGSYVGTARSRHGTVRITARFPAVVEPLRTVLARGARSIPLEGYDPAGERVLAQDRVAAFLDSLDEVLYGGLPFDYFPRSDRNSNLSGSLDLGRTITEFAARGIHHVAVVNRSEKEPFEGLCGLVRGTVAVVEDADLLTPEEASRLAFKLRAFPPTSSPVARGRAIELLSMVRTRNEGRSDVQRLCDVAEEILTSAVSDADVEYAAGDASFQFTDTNALWERGLHRALTESARRVGLTVGLHPYSRTVTRLFDNGGPNIDPDVVVFDGSTAIAVVDAKNLVAMGTDSAGVYQVLAYAKRLSVPVASLAYLSSTESTWYSSFGDGEVLVSAFGVGFMSSRSFVRDLSTACGALVDRLIRV